MGIFRKLGDWMHEKSDRFIRGEAPEGGYYATQEAQQAYGHMGDENAEAEEREPVDPFGHGGGEYGGRVPYRSRYDMEREAQQQPQQLPQQQPVAQSQPAPQQQSAQQPQGYPGNVVPFPGMRQGGDGSVYAHVEYVVLLRSRNECKDVIAYIKSNASVFLNMEFIASDSERQRCVDMLSGAAYTLGCALNKISPRGMYLISSPSVRVVLDPAMQKFTAAPEAQGFARQRYEADPYAQQAYAQAQQPDARENQPQVQAQPAGVFGGGSPTMRFRAQQGVQHAPTSFGSVMAGNATGMYAPVQPVQPVQRYANVQQ